MTKYFDVHNHLFNKNFLGKELLYRLMKELKKFLIKEEEVQKGVRGTPRGLKKIITVFKRYRKAIKVFMQNDSIAIYEELNKTYKGDFTLTPLTFDLTWCFASSADRGDGARTRAKVQQVFDSEMNSIFESIEKKARVMSRDYNAKASAVDDVLWQEYLAEKELLSVEAAALKEKEITRGGGIIPSASAGWDEQLRQIKELKGHPISCRGSTQGWYCRLCKRECRKRKALCRYKTLLPEWLFTHRSVAFWQRGTKRWPLCLVRGERHSDYCPQFGRRFRHTFKQR
jgi:hypothetical protein